MPVGDAVGLAEYAGVYSAMKRLPILLNVFPCGPSALPQTLRDIKALLSAHGLSPSKALGQNFLHDHNQLAKVVSAANVAPGDTVLEVGPGTGTLTDQLLQAGARVVAIELDRGLITLLQDRLAEPLKDRTLTLIQGDALAGKHTLNPEVIAALKGSTFKLVANLPYQVASPLMINLAQDHPSCSTMVAMIQLEVAQRLTAAPGGKQYGPMTVILQALFEAETIAKVPPGCFVPPPKVDSAVVRLTRRAEPFTDDPKGLGHVVHTLFAQRRKQIGPVLRREWGEGIKLPQGVNPTDRPERLTIGDWVALHRAVENRNAPGQIA